jgi:hypothetical protein
MVWSLWVKYSVRPPRTLIDTPGSVMREASTYGSPFVLSVAPIILSALEDSSGDSKVEGRLGRDGACADGDAEADCERIIADAAEDCVAALAGPSRLKIESGPPGAIAEERGQPVLES